MIARIDPWQTALRLLSEPTPRVVVLPPSLGGRWLPGVTRNPRHSRSPYFTPAESIAFIRTCLYELVSHRTSGRPGFPRGIVAREETYQRDSKRRAFVLVIAGRGFAPPVYVKWLLGPDEEAPSTIELVSFHESQPSRPKR